MVNPVLKEHGWAILNVNDAQPTCRVLGAFLEDGTLVETFTMQLYPTLGPMVRHVPDIRDSGETSRRLASIMEDWLIDMECRDFLVVANSPVTERLCARFGMKKMDVPIYVKAK